MKAKSTKLIPVNFIDLVEIVFIFVAMWLTICNGNHLTSVKIVSFVYACG